MKKSFDVFVCSFIRMLGNALGLDGESLATLVPTTQKTQSLVNTREEVTREEVTKLPCKKSKLQFSPIHLYIGYTTLVASAVSCLSLVNGQSVPYPSETNSYSPEEMLRERLVPSSTLFLSESSRNYRGTAKSGIQSNGDVGVNMGVDIAPPERLQ